MKTKLLKLALCAFVSALPLGAWADINLISYTFTAEDVSSYGNAEGATNAFVDVKGTPTGTSAGVVSFWWLKDKCYCRSVSSKNSYSCLRSGAAAIKIALDGEAKFKPGDKVSVSFTTGDTTTESGFYVRTATGTTTNQLTSPTATPGSTTVTKDVTLDSNFELNTIYIQFTTGANINVSSISVTRPAYNVTHTLTEATATSGSTGENAATYNTEYSAVFAASDGYVLPDAITVTIGGEEKTVDTDYTWAKATGTVTIPAANVTGAIVITVTATKIVVTTAWNFEQYMPGVNMLGTKTAAPDYIEYADGLYLHSRDADSGNHLVATADVTLGSTLANGDITSQTKTFKQGNKYTAVVIKSGDNSQAAKSATSASDNKSYSGIAYTAPADGTLYYTYYVNTVNGHIYVYKNGGDQVDNGINYNSTNYDGKGGELSVSMSKGDYVCITTSAANLYILNVTFKPSSAAVAKTKNINITSAGYATFCANENYTWTDPNLKAYIVSEVDETKATMQEISMIPAGTGAILAGPEGAYTLTSTESITRTVENSLRANLKAYALPADDGTNYNYTLAAGPTFKHSAGSGSTLAAGKAFLRTTVNVTEAHGFTLDFGGTTDISKNTVGSTVDNGKWYTLQGVEVKTPTKGLYIVNGKKVIIK